MVDIRTINGNFNQEWEDTKEVIIWVTTEPLRKKEQEI
jgi:hypothetical protein